MIVFVSIDDSPKRYAFFDTETKRLLEFNGNQSWTTVGGFIEDCSDEHPKPYLDLIPPNWRPPQYAYIKIHL